MSDHVAMREHLIRWFSPPNGESPAETLRWVRRISLAAGVGVLLLALQTWGAQGAGWDVWVLAGAGVLSLNSWFTSFQRYEKRSAAALRASPIGNGRAAGQTGRPTQ